MPVIPTPTAFTDSKTRSYSLDISGLVGFFSNSGPIAAMGTRIFYPGGKYLGWYNSPGSYEMAKTCGRLCQTRLWAGLRDPNHDSVDPADLFRLNNKCGPRFYGVHSGKWVPTGHLGHLCMGECRRLDVESRNTAGGRTSGNAELTIPAIQT
ncbi:hypothetical protein C8Q76DRAFT_692087 [Earliella scabrosa]|nr:hypothetical protein C8Q76DRAFT_692087 [Earliella scabrosa]